MWTFFNQNKIQEVAHMEDILNMTGGSPRVALSPSDRLGQYWHNGDQREQFGRHWRKVHSLKRTSDFTETCFSFSSFMSMCTDASVFFFTPQRSELIIFDFSFIFWQTCCVEGGSHSVAEHFFYPFLCSLMCNLIQNNNSSGYTCI